MARMYVKIYKRKRDGTYTANVVGRSNKKGKAVKVAAINV